MSALAMGAMQGGAAALEFLGNERANAANAKMAREQMKFQERMSNTQYQRAAKDLKAAGLNRVLALGNPASSPGGAQASMTNSFAGSTNAVNSYTANEKARQEMEAIKAQTRLLGVQADNVVQDSMLKHEQTRLNALEASKQQVLKSAYDAADPSVRKVVNEVKNLLNTGSSNAKQESEVWKNRKQMDMRYEQLRQQYERTKKENEGKYNRFPKNKQPKGR